MPSKKKDKAPVRTKGSPSFKKNILPLFRKVDIAHMRPMGVLLSDYRYMSTPANAQSVYSYLAGDSQPRMPIGGPFWTPAQLQLFNNWMTAGYQP
jgi:hypothetical protein